MKIKLIYRLTFCCFLFSVLSASAQNFTSSNLPIILIKQNGKWINEAWLADVVVEMHVIDNGYGQRNYIYNTPNNYKGNIVCRIQGSSSIGLPKKSFRISTINAFNQQVAVPLLGMPAGEDWVLKAPYQDKSLIRDDLTFRLFNQMGHYSSRSRFVELVKDSAGILQYCGVYQLLEKIRRDDYRVNILKLNPYDVSGDYITGGYIISLDKFTNADQGWYSKYYSNSSNDSANYYLYYSPKGDSLKQVQKDYIHGYVDQFETAVFNKNFDPNNGYRKYVDVPSLIDFLIINELSRNVDGYRASTFMHKDKNSSGNGKLKAGPIWDFNIAWGNANYLGGNDPSNVNYAWQYTQYTNINFVPFWWRVLMTDQSFLNELRCRYVTLRNSVLSESALMGYIDFMAAEMEESQQRNFTRWKIMGTYVWPNNQPPAKNYGEEIGYLKWFVHERLKFMDYNLPGICTGLGTDEKLPNPLQMEAFPNPFSNTVHLNYFIGNATNVKIELVNMLGKQVMLLREGDNGPGEHDEDINTSDLPPGTYLLKVTANNTVSHQKVIKI